jgi:hypothetical protein
MSRVVISRIGWLPSAGNTWFSSEAWIASRVPGVHARARRSSQARATFSSVFKTARRFASLASLRKALGSTPAATCWRASSRRARASASVTSG